MKKEIKKALEQLVGFGFTGTSRVDGTAEYINFGELGIIKDGTEEWQVGEFNIRLECPWRITKGNILLIGSDDFAEQPDETAEYDENFNWNVQGGNLRDVKMTDFLNSGKYIVESVQTDEFGGFELTFNDNVKLTVFPAMSSKSEHNEFWGISDSRDEGYYFTADMVY